MLLGVAELVVPQSFLVGRLLFVFFLLLLLLLLVVVVVVGGGGGAGGGVAGVLLHTGRPGTA